MDQLTPISSKHIPKQLVVWINNTWNFFDLGGIKFTTVKNTKYSVMSMEFGTVDALESNPMKVLSIGKPGDYLFSDSEGLLSVVPKAIAKFYV